MKVNKDKIFYLKASVILIINVWLIVIFWKIILLDGASLTNNNIVLTKIGTWLNEILSIIDINIISPNNIKMIIVSIFILIANLSVLYFNKIKVIIIGMMASIARYSYKSYTSYVGNKENWNYMGFEKIKAVKETDKAEIEIIKPDYCEATSAYDDIITIEEYLLNEIQQIIPTISKLVPDKIVVEQASTNWWMWGAVIAVGLIAAVGIGIAIWSHNTNAGNLKNVNQGVESVNTSLNGINNNLNEKFKILEKNMVARIVDAKQEANSAVNTSTITSNINYCNLDTKITNIEKSTQLKYNLNQVQLTQLDKKVNNIEANLEISDNYSSEQVIRLDKKIIKIENKVNSLGIQDVTENLANESHSVKTSQESLKLTQKLSEVITEISESPTTTEGMAKAVAKIVEIVKERLALDVIGTNTETIKSPIKDEKI